MLLGRAIRGKSISLPARRILATYRRQFNSGTAQTVTGQKRPIPALRACTSIGVSGTQRAIFASMASSAAPENTAGTAPAAPAAAPAAVLDRSQFSQQALLTAIRIPKQQTQHYMKMLSKLLFNKPRLRNVLEDPCDPNLRLLLLDESLSEADLVSREVPGKAGQSIADLVQADGLSVTTATVDVDYSYWSAQAVLQRLLPEGVEVPSAFETVGHVAHLNLRAELLPYKHIIGQVLLDKNPRLKTVVNKVASIENEFRVFPMEVLAGEDSTETEVQQHGARFKLDFKKVYWNSRLEREHQRLVQLFQPGEVVLDAMAGIGPFAIPAAQKGCLVYANDLNPSSYEYLCTNIRINRLSGKVLPFNLDGRDCMRQAAAGQLDVEAAAKVVPPAKAQQRKMQQEQQPGQAASIGAPQLQPGGNQDQAAAAADAGQAPSVTADSSSTVFQHVVMNLPAAAVEFLDALNGSFCPELWQGQQLPLIHVYTFAKGEEELAGLRQRVEQHLGGQLDEEPTLHVVRDVAPKKLMMAVTFRLPASIAFAASDKEGEAKRQKLG